jgi:hypothetical protein
MGCGEWWREGEEDIVAIARYSNSGVLRSGRTVRGGEEERTGGVRV